MFVSSNALLPNVGGVVALTVILVRLVQSEKAQLPILVTPLGISILVRLVQYWKALSPILVTPLGIVTLVRL